MAPMQATAVGYAEQLKIARLSVNSSHDGSCHAEVLGERPLDCRFLPTSFAGTHFMFRPSHWQKKSVLHRGFLVVLFNLVFVTKSPSTMCAVGQRKQITAHCCRSVLTSEAVVFQCCQN